MSAIPRLFVAPEQLGTTEPLRLRGAEHHYLTRVLRLGIGDKVLLLDGNRRVAAAHLQRITAEELELAVAAVAPTPTPAADETRPRVALYMGQLKGERHELVLQKATELGAQRIVTVVCHRSVPTLPRERERAERRQQRWQRIAQAAAQQCRRPDLPEVSAPLPFSEALSTLPAAATSRLMLYEGTAPPLRSVLVPAEELALLIGPEGGFEPGEVEQAMAAGFIPCSLGPRVLRAETAALAALAVVTC